MKKNRLLFIVVGVLLITTLMLGLASCADKNGENGETPTPPKEYGVIQEPIAGINTVKIVGYCRDIDYNKVAGMQVLFNEENAAITGEDGTFEFIIANKDNKSHTELLRDVDIVSSDYNFTTNIDANSNGHFAEFVLIVADKNANINLSTQVVSIGGKVTFNKDGIELPAGYRSRGKVVNKSENGETRISDVELWVGDNLVAITNEQGTGLEAVAVGTVVEFRLPGFAFYVLTTDENGKTVSLPLLDNKITITGSENDLMGIRGEIIDEALAFESLQKSIKNN